MVSGRLRASRQQAKEGIGDTASPSALMVIGNISMHFHVELCHKFTWLQMGLLPAETALGRMEMMRENLEVVQILWLISLDTPSPSLPVSSLASFSWEGGLRISTQSSEDQRGRTRVYRIRKPGAWRDGWAAKSTCCSYKGPEFGSQRPSQTAYNHL